MIATSTPDMFAICLGGVLIGSCSSWSFKDGNSWEVASWVGWVSSWVLSLLVDEEREKVTGRENSTLYTETGKAKKFSMFLCPPHSPSKQLKK